ncbi:unnamed protein product [Prorocentrum cordatum]|uniref:Uncharacterized protein n=1 Tax=Prorocentrum cordatum TaxID=2364126 RepID=A0ABN9PA20_9DINO|nr:unnamed protein product [Polarella glacialis]
MPASCAYVDPSGLPEGGSLLTSVFCQFASAPPPAGPVQRLPPRAKQRMHLRLGRGRPQALPAAAAQRATALWRPRRPPTVVQDAERQSFGFGFSACLRRMLSPRKNGSRKYDIRCDSTSRSI